MMSTLAHRAGAAGSGALVRGLTAICALGAAVLLASTETPVRGPVTAVLLLVTPGWAAATLFGKTTWQARLAIAAAATLIVNVAVAQVMLVAGTWSPRGGVIAVALVSAGPLAYGLVRSSSPSIRTAPSDAGQVREVGTGRAPAPGRGPAARMAAVPSHPVALRVEVVRPTDLSEAECERWRTMQRRTPSLANPFLAPEFARAVGRAHDDARVAVLSMGPDVVGFFAFDRCRCGIGRPIGAGLTDCQGLVHVPGLDLDARWLLRACGLSVFEFDHLVEGQPFFEPYTVLQAPSPIMDLSDGYAVYEAQLRQSSRKFLRTTLGKRRRLAHDIGELRFDYEVRDAHALRQLMRWKSDQYRRTGRVDRFARPWIVGLVEHLLDVDEPMFAGSLSMLYAGDQPIAGHFGLRSERALVGWFPAYDVRFARYSPGLVQHLWMAEAAAAAGIEMIDLGRGGREYKDALKSREVMVAEGHVSRASVAAAAYRAVRAPIRSARNLVVARPQLFGLADRVLKQYGRLTRAGSSRPSRPSPWGDAGSSGRDGVAGQARPAGAAGDPGEGAP